MLSRSDIKNDKAYSSGELYDKYAASLYTYILKIVPDNLEAENILTSIFIQIFDN